MNMPWLLPKKISSSATATVKKSRKYTHEIFRRLADACEDDDFYKEKFLQLATRKGIPGLKFENNVLRRTVGRGRKRQESFIMRPCSEISDEKLPELIAEVKQFLQDSSIVERNSNHVCVFQTDITWSDLNKKSRGSYVVDFVLNKKYEYNLSLQEANQLITIINIYLLAKKLNANDFVFRHGKLYAINGLSFDKQLRLWSFPDKPIIVSKKYRYTLHAMDIIANKVACSDTGGTTTLTED